MVGTIPHLSTLISTRFFAQAACLASILTAFFAFELAAKDEDKMAPNWMMYSTKGAPVELYSDLEAGHPVVMVFWATWCKFCEDLMPKLNAMSMQSKPADKSADPAKAVKYYALNIWENADPVAYLKKHDITLPIFLKADNVARRYNVKATPGVFVVAPDKRIVYERRSGQRTDKILRAVESSLAKIYSNAPAVKDEEKAKAVNVESLKALPVSSKTDM